MRKTIIILIGATVTISLLWLVDEKFLTKTSNLKSAEKQQETETVQRISTTEQKTKAKPTSKPPVYDLSQKAHWYDPEITVGYRGSFRTLSEWLKPFHPTTQEFQDIAQYGTSRKKLRESLSEDEYYSVEGRKRLNAKIDKLMDQLHKQLGEERYQFYVEVRDLDTGYYNTWEVLTANGISEDRVPEFRKLADEFNQQAYDRPLYRGDTYVARPAPGDNFRIDIDEKERIAQSFRERIEKKFGKQVLDDILFTGGLTVFMDQLDRRSDPMRVINIVSDPEQRARLKKLYGIEFSSNREAYEKQREESNRLENRENELLEEWAKREKNSLVNP